MGNTGASWRDNPGLKLGLVYLGFAVVFGLAIPGWFCRHYDVSYFPLDFYRMSRPGGDYIASYVAANALWDGLSIYENHGDRGERFQDPYAAGSMSRYSYPPLQAYVLMPLSRLPFEASHRAWMGVTLVLVLSSLFLASRVFETPWIVFLSACSIYAQSTFLWFQLERGQTDALMLVSIALMMWFYLRRRNPVAAGVMLGCATMLKVIPGIFFLFFLLRREFKVIVSAVATAFVIMLFTGGLGAWTHWLTQIMPQYTGTFIGNNVDHSLVYLYEGLTGDLAAAARYARITAALLAGIYVVLVLVNKDCERYTLIEVILLSIIMEISTPWAINYKLVVMAFFFLAPFGMMSIERARLRPVFSSIPLFLAFVMIVPFFGEYLMRLPFSVLSGVLPYRVIPSNPLDPYVTDRKVLTGILLVFVYLAAWYLYAGLASRRASPGNLERDQVSSYRPPGRRRAKWAIVAVAIAGVGFLFHRAALACERQALGAIERFGPERPINEDVSLAGYWVERTSETRYRFTMVFHAHRPTRHNLALFLHAQKKDGQGNIVECAGRNFFPGLITSFWPRDRYFVATTDAHIWPSNRDLMVGLFDLSNGRQFGTAHMATLDLAAIAR